MAKKIVGWVVLCSLLLMGCSQHQNMRYFQLAGVSMLVGAVSVAGGAAALDSKSVDGGTTAVLLLGGVTLLAAGVASFIAAIAHTPNDELERERLLRRGPPSMHPPLANQPPAKKPVWTPPAGGAPMTLAITDPTPADTQLLVQIQLAANAGRCPEANALLRSLTKTNPGLAQWAIRAHVNVLSCTRATPAQSQLQPR